MKRYRLMHRVLTVLILVSISLVLLAACGRRGQPEPTPTIESPTETQMPAQKPTDTPTLLSPTTMPSPTKTSLAPEVETTPTTELKFRRMITDPDHDEPCHCSGPDLNCKDFADGHEADACFEYCRNQGYDDPHHLDRDKDLLPCESLRR